MKKPKKIKGVRYDRGSNSQKWKEGYNQAIDDYEKFLPSVEEIYNLICDTQTKYNDQLDRTIQVAKAIAKRIGVIK